MGNRTPSLQEVLVGSMDYQLAGVYTAIPGVVVGIKNLGQMRVDVQPSINLRDMDGQETSPRQVIENVPLQMPLTETGGLSFPIKKGCPILIVFSMRGLDVWKKGNGLPDMPSDMRKLSMRDAIAIPSIYPPNVSPNAPQRRSQAHSPDDVVLVHNIGTGNEVEIRLKPDGGVVINSPKKVVVNSEDAEVNTQTCVVNAQDFSVNAENVDFQCATYNISTGAYTMSATDLATSTGILSHNGSFVLNGTPVENHDHGGVEQGGSRTNPFGS